MNAFFVLCLAAAAVAEPWNLYNQQAAILGYNQQPALYAAQPSIYAAQPSIYAAQPSIYAAQPSIYAAQPSIYAAQPAQAAVYQPSFLKPTSYKAQVGDKLIQKSPGNTLITKIQKREAEAEPWNLYNQYSGIYNPVAYQQAAVAGLYHQAAPVSAYYQSPLAAASYYQPAKTVQNHAASPFQYANKNQYVAKSAGGVFHIAKREADSESDAGFVYGSNYVRPAVYGSGYVQPAAAVYGANFVRPAALGYNNVYGINAYNGLYNGVYNGLYNQVY